MGMTAADRLTLSHSAGRLHLVHAAPAAIDCPTRWLVMQAVLSWQDPNSRVDHVLVPMNLSSPEIAFTETQLQQLTADEIHWREVVLTARVRYCYVSRPESPESSESILVRIPGPWSGAQFGTVAGWWCIWGQLSGLYQTDR